MRLKTMLVFGLTALGTGACKDKSGITDPRPLDPAATIRFINGVVDTGTVDFRFQDKVENLPMLLGVPFRGTSGFFTRVSPGSRPVRIFVNSTDPVETQKRLIDTTITLVADKRYTLIYAGAARGNADRLVVIEETAPPPSPPAGSVAIRALNADPGHAAADVAFAIADTTKPPSGVGADTVPVRPPPPRTVYPALATTISNVAYLTYSPYVTLSALPAGARDSLYQFQVATAGSGTIAYRAMPTQRGATAPAGASYGPQPGVQIAGSVLTAVLLPGATPGSKAATSSNLNPTVLLLVDKVLNP
jgi:hypothetical protein